MTKTAVTPSRKKGSLILTEGRSGSNWLGSLTKATGVLGQSEEWFARWALPKQFKYGPMDDYVTHMIEKASTPNGYFCVKIFPAHVHHFDVLFGKDLIQLLQDRYDCNFVSLARGDRMRQAVSYARGIQTQKWKSSGEAKRPEVYDAEMIARCFFLISRSYDYWDTTISIRQLDATKFVYEDLIGKPDAYVQCIAEHAHEGVDTIPESPLKIQRDETTEEWIERFKNDLPNLNIVAASTPQRQPRRDPSNLRRFLMAKAMKPFPYTY